MQTIDCPECRGEGEVEVNRVVGCHSEDVPVVCFDCEGTGEIEIEDDVCPCCFGNKQTRAFICRDCYRAEVGREV